MRYKCIKLYISATIQPIQMNEHSFCTNWNVPDGSIVNNAIMCKVLTLLFQLHINARLYIFGNKRTYCYILFSKPRRNPPFKLFLTSATAVSKHLLQLDFGGLDSSDDSDFEVAEHQGRKHLKHLIIFMDIFWCQQKFEGSVALWFGEQCIAVSSLISENIKTRIYV